MAGYPVIAANKYTYRLYKVATYINWVICKYFKIQTATKEKEDYELTVMLDKTIYIEEKTRANRLGILVKDHTITITTLLGVEFPSQNNTLVTEKQGKYKDVKIEISQMWDT